MSVRVMTMVWDANLGTPTRKLVMMRLADFSNDDGDNIFPSVARIAADCSVDRRTVEKTLAAFRAEGLLHVIEAGGWDGKKNRCTHYKLRVEKLATMRDPPAQDRDPPRQSAPTVPAQDRDRPGAGPGNPLLEPSSQPEPSEVDGSARARAIPPRACSAKRGTRLPDDWLLPEEWAEWAAENLRFDRATVIAEADRFRDYWTGLAGAKATKANWEATWRNWCRNSHYPHGGASHSSGSKWATRDPKLAATYERWEAEAARNAARRGAQ